MKHTSLYLAETDDEQDHKSAAGNTFNIPCGDGGYSPSLSYITLSLLATSYVVCYWIFTQSRVLPNDPLPNDDMVDWENYSMLGIEGVDTNIDKGLFMLENSW